MNHEHIEIVEGGSKGGEILFEGTSGDLKNCKASITARYL